MAPALLASLCSEPWLIAQEFFLPLIQKAEQPAPEHASMMDPRAGAEAPELQRIGNIAIIPICGVLMKFPGYYDVAYGGACDVDSIREMAEAAAADSSIDKVILKIHSPGGMITGIPEAADALQELSAVKDLYSFTESVEASAAYWLGCQADAKFCTPTSRLGSIGVYSIYYDQSEWLKSAGIKVNAIYAGEKKLAGSSFKAMTDEERADFQASVDATMAEFRETVEGNRDVAPDVMQGQLFRGPQAIANGLADVLVNSFEECLAIISG